MNFHENFFKYRKAKGFTQEEMAEKMEVSRQSVSKWENGEAVPDLSKVIKIAELLEVSVDELCGRETINKIETNQNIKAEQDIKLELKTNPVHTILIPVIIAIVIIVVSGVGGYLIGQNVNRNNTNDNIYELPNNMDVTISSLDVFQHTLSCRFVPEVYYDELEYTILLMNLSTEVKHSSNATFEDGIGSATVMTGGSGYFQVILQISNGLESQNIVLEDRIYINTTSGTVSFPEPVP